MVLLHISDLCVDWVRIWSASVVLSIKEDVVELIKLKQNSWVKTKQAIIHEQIII